MASSFGRNLENGSSAARRVAAVGNDRATLAAAVTFFLDIKKPYVVGKTPVAAAVMATVSLTSGVRFKTSSTLDGNPSYLLKGKRAHG